MNPKSFVIRLAIIATLALESAAFAQNAPNMPPRNPWLTDSVYPTSHFNPSATDSVLFAGPEKGNKLTRDKDVKRSATYIPRPVNARSRCMQPRQRGWYTALDPAVARRR